MDHNPFLGTYLNKNLDIEFEYFHADAEQKYVKFQAFLTDYKDSFQSNWNEEVVYGRNDPIYTFQNTKRVITLAWTCPSYSLTEARENMAKASRLMRFLYPTYSNAADASTITKPPLLRLKFANLAKKDFSLGLLGHAGGFEFAPDLEAGWWDGDHALQDGMTNLLYAKTLNFSCEFSVLHEQPLGWNDGTWEVINVTTSDATTDQAFDYEKNPFPFMPIRQSANETLGMEIDKIFIPSEEEAVAQAAADTAATDPESIPELDLVSMPDGSTTSDEYDAYQEMIGEEDWYESNTSLPETESIADAESLLGWGHGGTLGTSILE